VNDDGVREHLRDALLGAGQTAAVAACERKDANVILVSQHAFGHSMQDILTLGTLAKYAGANGKKFLVIVEKLNPDEETGESEE
jgi:hypothetical protein